MDRGVAGSAPVEAMETPLEADTVEGMGADSTAEVVRQAPTMGKGTGRIQTPTTWASTLGVIPVRGACGKCPWTSMTGLCGTRDGYPAGVTLHSSVTTSQTSMGMTRRRVGAMEAAMEAATVMAEGQRP